MVGVLGGAACWCCGGQARPDADALFHIEEVAGLGEAIDQGLGQMIVFQKGAPFAEAQVGGQEGGFALVAFLHEGEEQPDLSRFDLDEAQFVNKC